MKKQHRVLSFLLIALLVASCSALIVPAEEVAKAPQEPNVVTIYEENFDTLSTIQGYADLGWSEAFNGSRVTLALDQEADNNTRLKVTDSGWSSLRFVSKEDMAGVASYTVSMDLTISKLKFWGIIYNNATDGNNQSNTGMIQIRTENDIHYVANAGKKNNSYFCASYSGEGAHNGWGGQWAPIEKFLNNASLFGTEFKFTMTVDMVAATCSVYINDTFVNTCENTQVNENGIDFLFQNQECYLDNIKVTAVMAAADEGGESEENSSQESESTQTPTEESSEAATTKKPAATTSAPSTEAAPETTDAITTDAASSSADEAKGGCASALSASLAMVMTVTLAATAVSKKKTNI